MEHRTIGCDRKSGRSIQNSAKNLNVRMFFFEIFFIERSTSKPENYKDFKLSHKLDCIKRFIGSDKSGKSFWKSSFIIHIWGNGLEDDRCFTRPAIAEKADY